MGDIFRLLYSRRVVKTGIAQMLMGFASFFLQIFILIPKFTYNSSMTVAQISVPGLWAGVFYIVSGVTLISAGTRPGRRSVLATMIANLVTFPVCVVHALLVSWSIGSEDRRTLYADDDNPLTKGKGFLYPLNVFLYTLAILCAYAQLCLIFQAVLFVKEAVVAWKKTVAPAGVHGEKFDSVVEDDNDPDRIIHVSSENPSPPENRAFVDAARFIGGLQSCLAATALILNLIILIVVDHFLHQPFVNLSQTTGSAIFAAPFFFLATYSAISAAKAPSDRRVVAFLCSSILCEGMSFLEGMGPALALANRDWAMKVHSYRKCDRYGNCETFYPSEKERDGCQIYLVILNAFILAISVLHFALSVWGVVASCAALVFDGVGASADKQLVASGRCRRRARKEKDDEALLV